MASTYLTKTFSGAPTNAKKGTISLWFKLAGSSGFIFSQGYDGNNNNILYHDNENEDHIISYD
jgi:hypothetical protein